MSREPRCVRTTDRSDLAARVLWEQDCGFVPVLDAVGALVGVVTDRDLCMASYTQGRALAEIAVTEVMAKQVHTASPRDPLATALATMQAAQVHRLPVVDARGRLVGVLATNDLVRGAAAPDSAVDAQAVLRTLAAIGRPRHAEPAPVVIEPPAGKPAAKKATKAPVAAAAPPRKAKTAARGKSKKS